MSQVTGIVYVKVNGALLRSKEGAKLNLGGKERSPVVGHSVYGFTEKVVPATVECTLAHTADTDLVALGALTGATVQFETDTGVTFVVANAFTTKTLELKGGDGEVTLEMNGDPAFLS